MKWINRILGIVILVFSFSAIGQNVMVKGTPITLIPYKQIYQLPANYNLSDPNFIYAVIDGMGYACYSQANSQLQSLQMRVVTIYMNGQNKDWNCYYTGSSNTGNGSQ